MSLGKDGLYAVLTIDSPDHDGFDLEFFSERPKTPPYGGDEDNWPPHYQVFAGYLDGGDSVVIEVDGGLTEFDDRYNFHEVERWELVSRIRNRLVELAGESLEGFWTLRCCVEGGDPDDLDDADIQVCDMFELVRDDTDSIAFLMGKVKEVQAEWDRASGKT